MAGFSTDGIVLKRIDYGDHDLIVTFFTVSMGRISVMAKNAKKSVKRFAGALEPFSAMNLECTWPKRKNTLPILNNVELSNPFSKIRTNTAKTGYACYWLELVNAWMEEGKTQAGLYELLYYVLAALDSGTMEKEILSLLFQIRFMNLSGFTPDLTCCGTCATPLDEIRQQRITFDFAEGQLVCGRCGKKAMRRHAITVSKGTLKQLFWINNSDLQRAERLRFSPCTVREGEALLEAFIPCHIGREVKSLTFLRRIREVA